MARIKFNYTFNFEKLKKLQKSKLSTIQIINSKANILRLWSRDFLSFAGGGTVFPNFKKFDVT